MLLVVMRILATLMACSALCAARKVTVVIDDTYGDTQTQSLPVYTPQPGWNPRYAYGGVQCTWCTANPDGYKMRMDTWHDTTWSGENPANVSFQFSGSVVRIYCALSRSNNWETHLSFYLDDNSNTVDQFHHVGEHQDDFLYQQLVYEKTHLSSGKHTMVIRNGALGHSDSLLLFDYAEYELDVPDPTTSAFTAIETSTRSTTSSSAHPLTPIPDVVTTSWSTTSTTELTSSFSSISHTTLTSDGTTQDTVPALPASNKDTSRAKTISIIGASIGGIVALAVLFAAGSMWRRRRMMNTRHRNTGTLQAFELPVQPDNSQSDSTDSDRKILSPSSATTLDDLRSVNSQIYLHDEVAQMRTEIERLRRTLEIPPQYDLRS